MILGRRAFLKGLAGVAGLVVLGPRWPSPVAPAVTTLRAQAVPIVFNPFDDGEWHHVAAVYRGGKVAETYVDGMLSPNFSSSGWPIHFTRKPRYPAAPGISLVTDADPVYAQWNQLGGFGNFLDGSGPAFESYSLDDVVVSATEESWFRVMDASKVNVLEPRVYDRNPPGVYDRNPPGDVQMFWNAS